MVMAPGFRPWILCVALSLALAWPVASGAQAPADVAVVVHPGVAVSGEDLLGWALERRRLAGTAVTPNEAASAASFVMLRHHGLVTIPVIGMPGAAATYWTSDVAPGLRSCAGREAAPGSPAWTSPSG